MKSKNPHNICTWDEHSDYASCSIQGELHCKTNKNVTVNISQAPWWKNWFKTEPVIVNQTDHGLKEGDILLFKRNPNSKVAGLLAKFLKKMYRFWDGWGWHMAYIYKVSIDGSVTIAEATIGRGVQLAEYPNLFSFGEIRIYRWIDKPNPSELERYTKKHLGYGYDIACYFWTGLQLLIYRLFGRLIPRYINNKYTCWELIDDMLLFMGKPLQSVERYPVMPAMVKVLSEDGKRIY